MVVVLAQEEARRMDHNYIGTEHILLGLVSEHEGNATRDLSNLGMYPDKVRHEVVRVLSEGQEAAAGSIDRSADTRSTVFRARVEGLVVEAHCGVTDEERAKLQPLRVDLDYSYRVGEGDDLYGTVDYGTIIEGIASLVEREEFRLLETGARMVGEYVLNRFQSVWEVNVTVSKLQVPVAHVLSGVSVEATFRR
jgi:dihydroneopterin aldolase